MRMKINGGRVLSNPLSFAFSMQELGGTAIQKYNAISKAFSPDRSLTPAIYKPQLVVNDIDGKITTGDYAYAMRNVSWKVTETDSAGKAVTLTKGTDYTLKDGNAIWIMRNVPLGSLLSLDFHGEYYNATRNETSDFNWHKDLVSNEETPSNIELELRCPPKMNFSPFKNYGNNGQFHIEAAIRNGGKVLDAAFSVFKWQVFDKTAANWVDIDPNDNLWYVSGKDSGTIIINVPYLQKVLLRVEGYSTTDPTQKVSASTLLRRWYGQWDDRYEFAYSQFITVGTTKTKAIAIITNRQGDVTNALQYFDVQLFYRENALAKWENLGCGTEFEIDREKMEGEHQIGGCTRELSCLLPIKTETGKILCDPTGKPFVAQFPTSEIEDE